VTRQFGRTSAGRRRGVTFASLVVAAVVIPVAIAYACNPQAHVSLDKTSYQPGGTVTVYGSYFPGNASITVSGPTGSVPVTASPGGGFNTSLKAPSAPGPYTITASRPTGGFASASYSVSSPQGPATTNPGNSGNGQSSTSGAPSFREPQVSRSRGTATSQSGTATSQSGSGDTAGGKASTSRSGGGSATPSTVTGPSGQQVFAGSAPAAAVAAAPTVARSRSEAARTATAGTSSATQSALGDLYSNYQPGRTPSLMGASGAPSGGAGSSLGLGIGLLAFGFMSLVAGLTVAEARRRRTA